MLRREERREEAIARGASERARRDAPVELRRVARRHAPEGRPLRRLLSPARDPAHEPDSRQAESGHAGVHGFGAEEVDEAVGRRVVGDRDHELQEVAIRGRETGVEFVEHSRTRGHVLRGQLPAVRQVEAALALEGGGLGEERDLDDARGLELVRGVQFEASAALDVERDDPHARPAARRELRDAAGEGRVRRRHAERRGNRRAGGKKERECCLERTRGPFASMPVLTCANRKGTAPRRPRHVPRPDGRGDDLRQQPRRLGASLLAVRPCGVARLDADRPHLPVVPVHRGRRGRVLAREADGRRGRPARPRASRLPARDDDRRGGLADGVLPVRAVSRAPLTPPDPGRAAAHRRGVRFRDVDRPRRLGAKGRRRRDRGGRPPRAAHVDPPRDGLRPHARGKRPARRGPRRAEGTSVEERAGLGPRGNRLDADRDRDDAHRAR